MGRMVYVDHASFITITPRTLPGFQALGPSVGRTSLADRTLPRYDILCRLGSSCMIGQQSRRNVTWSSRNKGQRGGKEPGDLRNDHSDCWQSHHALAFAQFHHRVLSSFGSFATPELYKTSSSKSLFVDRTGMLLDTLLTGRSKCSS
jgi:hypothetical protein